MVFKFKIKSTVIFILFTFLYNQKIIIKNEFFVYLYFNHNLLIKRRSLFFLFKIIKIGN